MQLVVRLLMHIRSKNFQADQLIPSTHMFRGKEEKEGKTLSTVWLQGW